MEELTLQDLNKRLSIMGLEPEERRKIEEQILDIRTKAMEDFYAKKAELQREHVKFSNQSSEEVLDLERQKLREELQQKKHKREEETEIVAETLKRQEEDYKRYGQQIGNEFSNIMSGQEDVLKSFGDAMINVAFDVLGTFINTKITELIATGIAAKGKATAEATATPQSAVTFGAAGAVIAGILTGVITAAIGAAKSSLTGLKSRGKSSSATGNASYVRVPGKQSGGVIDVVRSQDGKKYPGADFDPTARGFISRPTVIVGDGPAGMSKEWVASNAAVTNPTISPLLNIIDQAQQAGTIRSLDMNKYIAAMQCYGRAGGGNVDKQNHLPVPTNSVDNSRVEAALDKFSALIKKVSDEGIPAYTVLDDFDKKQTLRNKSRKIGSK